MYLHIHTYMHSSLPVVQDPVTGALARLQSLTDVHRFLFTEHKAYAVALEPRPKLSKEALKTY